MGGYGLVEMGVPLVTIVKGGFIIAVCIYVIPGNEFFVENHVDGHMITDRGVHNTAMLGHMVTYHRVHNKQQC